MRLAASGFPLPILILVTWVHVRAYAAVHSLVGDDFFWVASGLATFFVDLLSVP